MILMIMITEEIEEGQYSCDGCYYQAKRSNHLKRHKIIKHPTMNESESKEALKTLKGTMRPPVL